MTQLATDEERINDTFPNNVVPYTGKQENKKITRTTKTEETIENYMLHPGWIPCARR